ncbi:MAG: hypothetical protein ACI80V_001853 [Rhodothermales bacterium]|jgi:hypothetical protein
MARLRSQTTSDHTDNLALILIDFDNLVESLGNSASRNGHRITGGMIQELRRYLSEELRVRPVRVVAYGDFGAHGEDAALVMTSLAAEGVETRHVPAGIQATDAAVSLTLHATELLHARPDLSAFVVLSGDNWYVPLIQHLQRFGKFVLVAALDLPESRPQLWADVSDSFLNARFLIEAGSRDAVTKKPSAARVGNVEGSEDTRSRAPKTISRVVDAGAYRTLELIEECFGQYEEVYLTPLLRKMSEGLDEEDGEPKDLVNLLQEAGVVWLEKRRGFPYDYTVMMVNTDHPDVAEVRAALPDDSDDDVVYGSSYEAELDHEYEDTEA